MTIVNNIIKIGLITLFLYIIYKTGIIEKIYIRVNQLIGITEEKKISEKKRKKYINRMLNKLNKESEY